MNAEKEINNVIYNAAEKVIINSNNVEYTQKQIETIIYELYHLAKFSNQVTFVDKLFENCRTTTNRTKIYNFVISNWHTFDDNRKDKFFYLLEKFNAYNLSEIITLECQSEIKIFLIKKFYNGTNEDTVKILEYALKEYNLGIVDNLLKLIIKNSVNFVVDNKIKKSVKNEAKSKNIIEQRRRIFSSFYNTIWDLENK